MAEPLATVEPEVIEVGNPLLLIAELTYRCPLHCPYCSNPTDIGAARYQDELPGEDWQRVFREAADLGVLQLALTGGEPMARKEIVDLVSTSTESGLYSTLVTSAMPFPKRRVEALHAAGLDHVQLSFQDSTREMNDFLSHTKTFELKNRVAKIIKDQGWPMVMNVVIHRLNIDHIDRIIGMAHELGAEYLELANTQYYSWAFLNRDELLPTRAQLERAEAVTDAWRRKLGDTMRLFFVAPDYHEGTAKKCVNGWGSMFLNVTPDGTALPCHTAKMLPGLAFPNVRDHGLREIWFESEGFNRYRGTGWMKEPCASCDMKEVDLGGCRCQAYLIAHDPAAADPVCAKSPHHGEVLAAVERAEAGGSRRVVEHPLVFRDPAQSRRIAASTSN